MYFLNKLNKCGPHSKWLVQYTEQGLTCKHNP